MSGGCRAGRHLDCPGDGLERCSCECHGGEPDWAALDAVRTTPDSTTGEQRG